MGVGTRLVHLRRRVAGLMTMSVRSSPPDVKEVRAMVTRQRSPLSDALKRTKRAKATRSWRFGTIAVAGLVLALLVVAAGPASALSDWDPDDVRGPLDLRRIGAILTSDDDLRLRVSFHDGFSPRALQGPNRGVHVELARFHGTEFLTGDFIRRRDGRIVFRYGDGAQWGGLGCIDETARVRRPSTNLLRVAFPIIGATYRVRATSKWVNNTGRTIKDGTGRLRLGDHNGKPRPCG